MVIETERLILRKPMLKDVKDLVENGNDYDVHYNSFFLMKYPFGTKEAMEVINEDKISKNLKRFVIELKEENRVIGVIDLYSINLKEKKLKLGYWIGKNHRRKGYVTEAVKALVNFSFKNFEIEKIIATTLINNEPSMKFLETMHFKKDKVLKNDRFLEGKYVDSVQFVLTRRDFLKNN
jgi:RimJ/RimL family protein N-acetyltransferase